MGQVLLFGKLRDALGADRIAFPEGAKTAADLRAKLVAGHPDAAALIGSKSVRIAVNQVLVADEAGTKVSPADEVALLPPLSGG